MCPVVKIDIIEGKSTEYKNAVLDGVHQAIIKTFNVPESELLQGLYELPFNNFEYPQRQNCKRHHHRDHHVPGEES